MKVLAKPWTFEFTASPIGIKASKKEQIINYYEKSGRDYHTWSKKYNMHFGYYAMGMNPFNRESMLEQLNEQVLQRLNLDPNSVNRVADLGCGLGATIKYGAKRLPKTHFTGITLVPWQVGEAKRLASEESVGSSAIDIVLGDYSRTHLASNSLDGVIAIESSCYATGDSKSDLLKEIHRVLKPGARFVISDGFLKKPVQGFGILGHAYRQLCSSWALTELGNIKSVHQYLEQLHFRDIHLEDVSMNIAPSVAHVPFTVLYFLLKQWLFGKDDMNKERWNNLKSPLLSMILGSAQSHFGYYFVSGMKAFK